MPTSSPTQRAEHLCARLEAALTAVREIAVEVASVDPGEDSQTWVELAGLGRQVESAAAAISLVAGAQVSATDEVLTDDGVVVEVHRGLGHRRLDAPDLVAAAWGCSPDVASLRLTRALRAVTHLPGLVGCLTDGLLTEAGARVVIDAARDLDEAQGATLVQHLRPWLLERPGVAPSRVRVKAKALIALLAPESLQQASEAAVRDRGLIRFRDRLGAQTWEATLVNGRADLAWSTIDTVARGFKRDGSADTLEQARADALVSLVLDGVDLRVELVVAGPAPAADTVARTPVPVSALAVAPAIVPVHGLAAAPVEVPRTWLDELTIPADTAGTGTTARHVTLDPATGTSIDLPTRSDSYVPPARLARWVRERDGHCRFPGCEAQAVRCDLDHVVPWPAGPTEATNLLALCRHHHRVKQRPGWRLRLDPDGTAHWTGPHGDTRSTTPAGWVPVPPDSGADADRRTPVGCRSRGRVAHSRLEHHLALLPAGHGPTPSARIDIVIARPRPRHAAAYGPPPF